MSSLILAAGTQERWLSTPAKDIPDVKQLVKVEGEILIEKIQRQFPDSIVVTNNDKIKKHSKKWFAPAQSSVTVATLHSTLDFWDDWTTILLGDVLYGKKTVKLITNQEEPLMFYGNTGELFAMKFNLEKSVAIFNAINKLTSSDDFRDKYGKLWNLYRVLNWHDFREHYIKDYFTFVYDCQDFDNKAQYIKYAKKEGKL